MAKNEFKTFIATTLTFAVVFAIADKVQTIQNSFLVSILIGVIVGGIVALIAFGFMKLVFRKPSSNAIYQAVASAIGANSFLLMFWGLAGGVPNALSIAIGFITITCYGLVAGYLGSVIARSRSSK